LPKIPGGLAARRTSDRKHSDEKADDGTAGHDRADCVLGDLLSALERAGPARSVVGDHVDARDDPSAANRIGRTAGF
jgi:hypothetical protein